MIVPLWARHMLVTRSFDCHPEGREATEGSPALRSMELLDAGLPNQSPRLKSHHLHSEHEHLRRSFLLTIPAGGTARRQDGSFGE
jgi:hypothetical protein